MLRESLKALLALLPLTLAACGLPEDMPAEEAAAKASAIVDPTPGPTPTPEPQCSPFFKPDLVPHAQLIWPGVVYPLSVSVSNASSGVAGASTLRIEAAAYNGATYVGKVISTVNAAVPALSCGKSAAPTLPYAPPLHCGIYQKVVTHCVVTITADVLDNVDESKEANNVITFTVTP